jgi:CheY-like chemotaxis protein
MTIQPTWEVMVVDDMPQFGQLVEQYTRMVDFACSLRCIATLREAEKALKIKAPHLLLLDVNMPADQWSPLPQFQKLHKPGTTLAFCGQIASDPKLATMGIIMVSVESQIKEDCKRVGAHGFYNKYDFTVDIFEKVIRRISTRHPQA